MQIHTKLKANWVHHIIHCVLQYRHWLLTTKKCIISVCLKGVICHVAVAIIVKSVNSKMGMFHMNLSTYWRGTLNIRRIVWTGSDNGSGSGNGNGSGSCSGSGSGRGNGYGSSRVLVVVAESKAVAQ